MLGAAKKIPPQSKAVESKHNYDAERTRVLLDGPEGSASLKAIRQRLEQHPQKPFEIVADGQPFLIRVVEHNAQIQTFGPDGAELSRAVPTRSPDVLDTVEARLLGWARWFGLMKLNHPGSSPLATLSMIPTGAASAPRPGQPFALTPGENRYELRIKNQTSDTIYVYLLDLSSDGQSRLIYPKGNAVAPLQLNQELPLKNGKAFLVLGATYVRDVYKLIATTSEINHITALQMAAPKGANARAVPDLSDPLERLLFGAALGARQGAFDVPDNWSVSEVSFEVCQTPKGGRCVAR